MFEIQLFGSLEVRTRGIRLAGTDFGGVRPRRLLALLALHDELALADLAELLEVPAAGVGTEVAVLRDHLEPGVRARDSVVAGHRGRYRLVPHRVRVDVRTFDELLQVAAARPAERATKPLTAAAFLAARPLLVDEDAPWAVETRARYRAKLLMNCPAAVTGAF